MVTRLRIFKALVDFVLPRSAPITILDNEVARAVTILGRREE